MFQENDIAMLVAQQLYVDHQNSMTPANLKSALPLYIPKHLLQGVSEDVLPKWEQLVTKAFRKVSTLYVKVRIMLNKQLLQF